MFVDAQSGECVSLSVSFRSFGRGEPFVDVFLGSVALHPCDLGGREALSSGDVAENLPQVAVSLEPPRPPGGEVFALEDLVGFLLVGHGVGRLVYGFVGGYRQAASGKFSSGRGAASSSNRPPHGESFFLLPVGHVFALGRVDRVGLHVTARPPHAHSSQTPVLPGWIFQSSVGVDVWFGRWCVSAKGGCRERLVVRSGSVVLYQLSGVVLFLLGCAVSKYVSGLWVHVEFGVCLGEVRQAVVVVVVALPEVEILACMYGSR